MGFAKEFREFAIKGNVIDLAVGVIIGGAFSKIVDSVVGDLIMPLISKVTGGLDFSNYFVKLSSKVTAVDLADAKKQGAVLAWGSFLTIALNFIIVAWVLFWLMRIVTRMMVQEPPKAPPVTKQEQLLTEIRDLLKNR